MKTALQFTAILGIIAIVGCVGYYFVYSLPKTNQQKLQAQQAVDQQNIKTQQFQNCEQYYNDQKTGQDQFTTWLKTTTEANTCKTN